MAECMASLLECPICLSPFTDPRMLGCLHTLCHKCLSDLIATTGQSGQFDCPSCRKPQLTPPGGADGFQKNFFVNTYMDTVKNRPTEGGPPGRADPRNPCNNSEDGDECPPAEHFCTICCEYYCKTCSKAHRRSNATRSHSQVLLDEVTEGVIREARAKSEIPRCPKHEDEKLKLYCNSCQCSVCSVCCHISHQSHTFREMADVDVELKAELEAHIKQLKSLSDGVEQQSEQMKTSQEKLEASTYSARARTENTFKELIQMLNKKAKEIDQSLNRKAEDGKTQAAAQNKNFILRGNLLESLETFADDLLNKGTVYNRLASIPEIRNRVQELQTSSLLSKGDELIVQIPSSDDLIKQNIDCFSVAKEIKLNPSSVGYTLVKFTVTCSVEQQFLRSRPDFIPPSRNRQKKASRRHSSVQTQDITTTYDSNEAQLNLDAKEIRTGSGEEPHNISKTALPDSYGEYTTVSSSEDEEDETEAHAAWLELEKRELKRQNRASFASYGKHGRKKSLRK